MKDCNCTRREIIVNGLKVISLLGIAKTIPGCNTSEDTVNNNNSNSELTIDITENSSLLSDGGSIFISNLEDSERDIIVYRVSATEYNAFSSRCTHANGQVALPVNGKAICQLHFAEYDTSGAVTKGPATTDLKSFEVSLDGNIITIIL